MARKTIVPLYDGDDFERLKALRLEVTIAKRGLDAAEDRAADRKRSSAPLFIGDERPAEVAAPEVVAAQEAVEAAQAAYNDFVDEAAERAEEWELHPIANEQFRALIEAHPPRMVPVPGENGETRIHEDDDGAGVNASTFGKALLLFRATDEDGDEFRTVVRPELDEVTLRKRIKSLSEGEFRDMWQAAFMLNTGGVSDLKAGKYLPTRSSSGIST